MSIKIQNRGRKGQKGMETMPFVYDCLYDGVHPTYEVADRWFKTCVSEPVYHKNLTMVLRRAFLGEYVVFEQIQFHLISQNYWSFTETGVMGTENILWKFELDPLIFWGFTCIWSLSWENHNSPLPFNLTMFVIVCRELFAFNYSVKIGDILVRTPGVSLSREYVLRIPSVS